MSLPGNIESFRSWNSVFIKMEEGAYFLKTKIRKIALMIFNQVKSSLESLFNKFTWSVRTIGWLASVAVMLAAAILGITALVIGYIGYKMFNCVSEHKDSFSILSGAHRIGTKMFNFVQESR